MTISIAGFLTVAVGGPPAELASLLRQPAPIWSASAIAGLVRGGISEDTAAATGGASPNLAAVARRGGESAEVSAVAAAAGGAAVPVRTLEARPAANPPSGTLSALRVAQSSAPEASGSASLEAQLKKPKPDPSAAPNPTPTSAAPTPAAPTPRPTSATPTPPSATPPPATATPPPATTSPAPATTFATLSVFLPSAPAAYALPSGAVVVASTAELLAALARPLAGDIVLRDGTYDHTTYFVNNANHRLYAATMGRAILRAGLAIGANAAGSGALVRGLAFDVSDPAKTLHGGVVHVWGATTGVRILDTTISGNGTTANGLMVRQPEAFVAQRLIIRNFTSNGLLLDANDLNRTLAMRALLEDISVANVARPVPGSSNGTAESCMWVGNTATVRRVHLVNCAWMGLWTGTNDIGSTHEHLTIDRTPIGIYAEHFTTGTTFQRFSIGPNVRTGVNCEWADPAWGSRAGCAGVVIQDGSMQTSLAGVYLDQGTTQTTVRRVRFSGQSWAAIGDYQGVGNGFVDNDYSGIGAGAVPVRLSHLP